MKNRKHINNKIKVHLYNQHPGAEIWIVSNRLPQYVQVDLTAGIFTAHMLERVEVWIV